MTPATASERGAQSQVANKWTLWLHNPCSFGGSPPLQSEGQKQRWPSSGQGPHRVKAGGTITSGPQVGKVAT